MIRINGLAEEVWLAYAEALGERRSLDWVHEHLKITDSEVAAAIRAAAHRAGEPGHDPASRIVHRRHFKRIYERYPFDLPIKLTQVRRMFWFFRSRDRRLG